MTENTGGPCGLFASPSDKAQDRLNILIPCLDPCKPMMRLTSPQNPQKKKNSLYFNS